MLNRVKYIEAIGDGINRICDAINAHPLKPRMPVFNDVGGTVIAVLFGADLSEIDKKKTEYELNERQIKAMDYIKVKGKITNREYRALFAVGWDTAHRDLKELLIKRVVISEGAGRSTIYRFPVG